MENVLWSVYRGRLIFHGTRKPAVAAVDVDENRSVFAAGVFYDERVYGFDDSAAGFADWLGFARAILEKNGDVRETSCRRMNSATILIWSFY